MQNGKFDFLKKTNEFLEKIPQYADKGFTNVEGGTQKVVDAACERISYEISESIETTRKQVIKVLHGIYESYKATLRKLGPLAALTLTDPMQLLEPVKMIRDIICGPYYEALTTVTEMTAEVVKLQQNIDKIMNYKPPAGDMSLDKFKITAGTITMGEIMSGVPNPVNIPKPSSLKSDGTIK